MTIGKKNTNKQHAPRSGYVFKNMKGKHNIPCVIESENENMKMAIGTHPNTKIGSINPM